MTRWILILAVLLAVALAVHTLWDTDRGGTPAVDVPSWARVAPEQIEEAQRHGVPLAFENDLGMRFVLIPAGTFRMGSSQLEAGRQDDETLHEVTITKPFYLSIHEVTNGQFRAFEPDHPSFALLPVAGDSGSMADTDALPMAEVSWDEASDFAEWLSAQDASRMYGLPTEAQWERGCRAGTTTSFHWGPAVEAGKAHLDIDGTYIRGPAGPDLLGTLPVGSFQPNPWGLYDMHGNVLEWCADWYAPYPEHAVANPRGPKMHLVPWVSVWVRDGEDVRQSRGRARVQRGGGWSQLPRFCRSAARLRGMPTDRQDYIGFRLVSPLPEPDA